jgi:hypothetical protein
LHFDHTTHNHILIHLIQLSRHLLYGLRSNSQMNYHPLLVARHGSSDRKISQSISISTARPRPSHQKTKVRLMNLTRKKKNSNLSTHSMT